MMHQDNEYPDVLLCWRGPVDVATRAAMDDWIIRHFRKMKYKMAKAGRVMVPETVDGGTAS